MVYHVDVGSKAVGNIKIHTSYNSKATNLSQLQEHTILSSHLPIHHIIHFFYTSLSPRHE